MPLVLTVTGREVSTSIPLFPSDLAREVLAICSGHTSSSMQETSQTLTLVSNYFLVRLLSRSQICQNYSTLLSVHFILSSYKVMGLASSCF